MRKVKTTEDMQRSNSSSDRLTTKSDMENYWDRVHWELPSEEHLNGKHPLTHVPFWKDIQETVNPHRTADRNADLEASWPQYVE